MSRKTFFLLGLFTLLGFTSLGGLIIEQFQDRRFFNIFSGNYSIFMQIMIGLAYGYLAAWLAWQLIKTPILKSTLTFFSNLVKRLNLRFIDIVFISFCAGAGEEILFRGAIQPYLGIWLTAILFVALHGYMNPFNWRISIYGILMCLIIAGIGFINDYVGLTSAIAAHFMIDVYLFMALTNAPVEDTEH